MFSFPDWILKHIAAFLTTTSGKGQQAILRGREGGKCDILLIITKINSRLRLAPAKCKCENPTLLVMKKTPR